MFQFSKLQFGCIVILAVIGHQFVRDGKGQSRSRIFNTLFITVLIEIFFDGLTAYTVNHRDSVPAALNAAAHLVFLLTLTGSLYLVLLYILSVTDGLPASRKGKLLLAVPIAAASLAAAVFIPQLEYRRGTITDYSMGISVYVAYITGMCVSAAALSLLLGRWRFIERRKRNVILFCTSVTLVIEIFQAIFPEILCTSLALTLFVIEAYISLENPATKNLEFYHREMVMGFATLVEGKDGSTGGHIRRTTAYVALIAGELKKRGLYRNILTKDFMVMLEQAAPMHDIGKIAIPDAVLKKPGRLSPEEFEIMKTHAATGGEIIRNTFGHLSDNTDYEKIAYDVARHHHEKWNGKGYPDGLKAAEIPFPARIMAIADVFDAVSAKRCYRDAMPLDQCFEIIRNGVGTDFDPELATVFLSIRAQVEAVYNSGRERSEQGSVPENCG